MLTVMFLLLLAVEAGSQEPGAPAVNRQPELASGTDTAAAAHAETLPRRIVHEGIAIDFTLQHVLPRTDQPVPQEGDNVLVPFTITDTAIGIPLTGLLPNA